MTKVTFPAFLFLKCSLQTYNAPFHENYFNGTNFREECSFHCFIHWFLGYFYIITNPVPAILMTTASCCQTHCAAVHWQYNKVTCFKWCHQTVAILWPHYETIPYWHKVSLKVDKKVFILKKNLLPNNQHIQMVDTFTISGSKCVNNVFSILKVIYCQFFLQLHSTNWNSSLMIKFTETVH
jgi:hypothetical protein